MKFIKFSLSIALAAVCCLTAGFAQNIDEYNAALIARQPAQAQMLHDLGLFQGTDKGFELEKTMTRGEGAVMLTRLLGAEKEALANNYKSPFTDVPDWLSPYVGWLYQNKLTAGVSLTEYGTSQNVTFAQYAILLTRHIEVIPSYDYIVKNGSSVASKESFLEHASIPFLRKHAVDLSAHYLSVVNTASQITIAQELIEKKAITSQGLDLYAKPIFGSTFHKDESGYILRKILGVTIEQSARNGYQSVATSSNDYVVATRRENNAIMACILSEQGLNELLSTSIAQDDASSVGADIVFVAASKNYSYAICQVSEDTYHLIRYSQSGISIALEDLHSSALGYAPAWAVADDFFVITSQEGLFAINNTTDLLTKISDDATISLYANKDIILFCPISDKTRQGFANGASEIKSVDALGSVETILKNNPAHGIQIDAITGNAGNEVYFAHYGGTQKNGFTFYYYYNGTRIYVKDYRYHAFDVFVEDPNIIQKSIATETARLDSIYK